MSSWWKEVLSDKIKIKINPPIATLIEDSLCGQQSLLSSSGAIVFKSGEFTGRAADDKYVVRNEASQGIIDWAGKILSLTDETFENIKREFFYHLEALESRIYMVESSAGADLNYSLGVQLLTPSPVHALFCRQIMREKQDKTQLGVFKIYHAPKLKVDHVKLGTRSATVIALNFKTKEIIICGTSYCGEIKKSIFTVMNTLLPDLGVLPMHSGACADGRGDVSVFFGLSGTGKTTLSADEGMSVIGDDEHGLTENGIFNFEGGCYAKTLNLKFSTEPQIFQATNRFGSLLENVTLNIDSREIDYSDDTLTENGRATYPLTYLENIVSDGRGKVPSNFFFLSADAMGVLPMISKLDHDQAMYYFLLGYTAKVAGTEMGMKGISATFSHCFGAPFMLRRAQDYGELLKEFLLKNKINVWLINTGWFGGQYGIGRRYDLSVTRSCIRAVQKGYAQNISFTKDEVFDLQVPDSLSNIDVNLFRPQKLWASEAEYFAAAKKLKSMFDDKFKSLV